MPEALNFSKHFKSLVCPVMKEHGFIQKGQRFTRERNGTTEEVYFQRSQLNMPGTYFFYLNVQRRYDGQVQPKAFLSYFRLGPAMGWFYPDEDGLKLALQRATDRLVKVGLPYLDQMEAALREPDPVTTINKLVHEIHFAEIRTFNPDMLRKP